MHDYEIQMRRYGSAAVRAALRNLQFQRRTDNPIALSAARLAMRVINAVPAAKRMMFSQP
ncbi:MAG: hypothetical protein JOZ47_02835 [Kutzneria sp.]|nr:hypothetical protein [Kutzneria sp.]MBV9843998.1 hypothetical protein [Kutzneria sp.]